MARPRKLKIELTDDELKQLKSVIQKNKTSKTIRRRCQIIIDLNESQGKVLTHEQSAKSNGVCLSTVTNTVKKYPAAEARRIIKRLEIHYTPKHGSWLDIAEIELNVMTRQCLSRRIENITKVREELSAWEVERNTKAAKVNWQFRTEDARVKLISLYPTFTIASK